MRVSSSHHSISEEMPVSEPESQSHSTIQQHQGQTQAQPVEDQQMHVPDLGSLGYGELEQHHTQDESDLKQEIKDLNRDKDRDIDLPPGYKPTKPPSSPILQPGQTTIHGITDEKILDDPSEYHPMDILRRRNQQETHGEAHYSLEQAAPDAAAKGKGNSITHQLPSGPVKTRIGNGGAPFVTSKKGDYEDAKVDTDYDDIAKKLNHKNRKQQENMADAMLAMSRGEEPDLSRYTSEEKRAMSHLVGITQLAEQHPNRTPGSAALARASLRRIRDEDSTFDKEFNTKDGNYIPARKAVKKGPDKVPGGTQQMRDFVRGSKRYEEAEHTAANMSESEDEPMSEGKDDRMSVDE